LELAGKYTNSHLQVFAIQGLFYLRVFTIG